MAKLLVTYAANALIMNPTNLPKSVSKLVFEQNLTKNQTKAYVTHPTQISSIYPNKPLNKAKPQTTTGSPGYQFPHKPKKIPQCPLVSLTSSSPPITCKENPNVTGKNNPTRIKAFFFWTKPESKVKNTHYIYIYIYKLVHGD